MKQNNNMSDFAEKIASSVDVTETEIIIKCGIPCIEAILRVHQQQQLFVVYLTYVIVLAHT